MMANHKRMIHQFRALPVVLLGLLVGLWVVAGVSMHAHAASAVVGTCDEPHLNAAIAAAGNGGTVAFSCSGTINITSTVRIIQNVTLDGSGQSVTLDGGGTTQVLLITSGVQLTLKNLMIAHGSSASNGGGLENNDGTVTIIDSTFSNNSTSDAGGGLENEGGTVTIIDSTFSNNSASAGGGLGNVEGTVSISFSTIANNSGDGLFNAGKLNIQASIVGNNTGGNCGGTISSDHGYNLESGTDCSFTGTGDLQNTNPQLGPLANNGGPTQTLALLPSSPAIDQIPLASCSVAIDQRGVSRPQGSVCDIGAYEARAVDLINDTIALVTSFGNPRIVDKLRHVLRKVNDVRVCGQLADLIHLVRAEHNHGVLNSSQAAQVLADIARIQEVLSCSSQ